LLDSPSKRDASGPKHFTPLAMAAVALDFATVVVLFAAGFALAIEGILEGKLPHQAFPVT